jgi:ferrous iron transport protein B
MSEKAGSRRESTPAPWIALVGNPNSGKTAIFNLLTGLNQKVSNYPGVTVERKTGTTRLTDGTVVQVLDMPGTYSITPESFDERIVAEEVLRWIHGGNPPALIVAVVDASNLSRNLYLATQMLDLGPPVIIALNMMDLVHKQGKTIDAQKLRDTLGVAEVVPLSALEKWGIDELMAAIRKHLDHDPQVDGRLPFPISETVQTALQPLVTFFQEHFGYHARLAWAQSLRLIARHSVLELYNSPVLDGAALTPELQEQLRQARQQAIDTLAQRGISHRTLEATLRYRWLDQLLVTSRLNPNAGVGEISVSERVDRILTHRWVGPLIFVGILYFIFQSIFAWAEIPMQWIETGIAGFSGWLSHTLPPGIFRELLVEGVIAGVGAILVFLPQILILVFFLTLLEDTGYMARVAFMMDRVMTKVGLHGRSVLPLMSGYACAIPGIMATRTIDSWKERLVTILILPLMSCSARLPVYALMIGAFIPARKVFGVFDLQGLTLVFMYFLGTATALILARLFSRLIKIDGHSSFVMELPPYRMPLLRSVFRQVYVRGKIFILNAGRIIMAVSIVLWFLASFPKGEAPSRASIETSYAGRVGHLIEPVIRPLGFDWKIGVGLLTSFAAREVIVSTLATLYSVEEGEENLVNVAEALQNDRHPVTGEPLYSVLMALALMVFYVYAAQCMATFAIVRNETNSWKWPLFMIGYMTTLAYLGALVVYQGGTLLGFAG